jgi:hypothetical protein
MKTHTTNLTTIEDLALSWVVNMNVGDFAQITTRSTGGVYHRGNNHNNFCRYLIG